MKEPQQYSPNSPAVHFSQVSVWHYKSGIYCVNKMTIINFYDFLYIANETVHLTWTQHAIIFVSELPNYAFAFVDQLTIEAGS